jgi:hypothetical protein
MYPCKNTKVMSNEKQTAVDFLMDKLFDPSMMVDEQLKWFEEAKAMHKKEIKDAIFWGNIKGYDEHKRTWVFDEDEQYYNETFNPKEK